MKHFILLIIVLTGHLGANAQNRNDVWIPEKYVSTIIDKQPADTFRYPIECIFNPFNKCSLIFRNAEVRPVRLKQVIVAGVTKYQILNIEYTIGLGEISEDTLEKFKRSTVYLSKEDEKILVEIIDGNDYQKIYFINHIGHLRFEGIYNEKKRIEAYLKKQKP